MKAFSHPDQLLHYPRTYLSRGQMRKPQEVPERISAILQGVEGLGFAILQPDDHGMSAIAAIHSQPYLRFLATAHEAWKAMPPDWGEEVISNIFVQHPNALRGVLAQAAAYLADGSCPIGASTWRSAYASAQSAIAAANTVLLGEHASYALCRPPGHHARSAAAGGFCYLNNAAIAAQQLRQKFARVAIFDADMHHGQGIQEIFYARSDVFYVSVHGDPTNFYPAVAGFADETGVGEGQGFNLNLPMPHGSSERIFFQYVEQALSAIERYRAQALVFALGFDIYKDDPQATVSVSSAGFHTLGAAVARLGIPTVYVQEGGYCINAPPQNARYFFNGVCQR